MYVVQRYVHESADSCKTAGTSKARCFKTFKQSIHSILPSVICSLRVQRQRRTVIESEFRQLRSGGKNTDPFVKLYFEDSYVKNLINYHSEPNIIVSVCMKRKTN